MSRGLGKWQRLLYDAVTNHTPRPNPLLAV
jgi:hypothetical protein